ncbi:SycD/LcrH family type III secretion system chaperone [Diaphorobacter nitroreducens]|uniref:SycD/LcrH family type III secretion system chaperone n=1 Tax=Diaphorobacter nitroreducens TaxID=164759 RepID=UPI0035AE352B
MTAPLAPNTAHDDLSLQTLARQAMAHLGRGGVIGDLLDMNELQYEALYTVGHDLYTQARYEEASKLFGFLVMHNHLERRFIMAYAAALQMARDYANAISLYTFASVLDLGDPLPGFHTAECLIGLGMRNEAREGLAIVLRECGDGHADLRARAQALLDLLSVPLPTQPQENAK